MPTDLPADPFPVRLEAVHKVYPSGKAAVRGVSLALARGEVLGLLGPNGAGKSTIMKMLATIARPTAGSILYGADGRSLWDQPEAAAVRIKRQIGWMPEQPLLYSWLTAREFLRFLGRLLQIPRARLETRIEELVALVHLADAVDQFTLHYSYGMQRKTSLAACLLHDPALLLLDEPTAGVDPQGVRDIKDLIALLKSQGKGILVSTHILDTAEKICDRVAIVAKGELVFVGDVEHLRRELRAPSRSSLEDLFIELTHAKASDEDALTKPAGARR